MLPNRRIEVVYRELVGKHRIAETVRPGLGPDDLAGLFAIQVPCNGRQDGEHLT